MIESSLDSFKEQFHRGGERIHLNHAGQSLLSLPARKKLEFCAQLFFEEGAFSWLQLQPQLEWAKKTTADFLGVGIHELAYFQSTAGAISQIALGFPLRPDDEILIWDQEYPSNHYPWAVAAQRSGAKLVVVESEPDLSTPAEKILAQVTARTRLITTSWVQYRSGAMVDIKKLTHEARRRGIFTCADIIQGAGVRAFNFRDSGLDAACGGSHKWLMGAHGVGYLLLRSEHLDSIFPLMVGAMTYGTPDDPVDLRRPLRGDASRYEPGGKAFAEIVALAASLDLVRQVGGVQILADEAERLCLRLKTGLEKMNYRVHSPHGSRFSGAILNFTPTPDSPLKSLEAVERQLVKNQVSYAKRSPGIRLSAHAMMKDVSIDRALEILSGKD